ncbi:MAG: HD domain-containing protein [Nanobdellota archaeon]
MIKRAVALAKWLHEGQLRRDKTPVINHCEAVVNLLQDIRITNPYILAAAWLHDSMEECEISRSFLAREFDDYLADIVATLTRDVGRQEYLHRIRNASYPVKIVKLADTLHNCQCLNTGIREGTIVRKCEDCTEVMFDLAEEIAPYFALLMREYMRPHLVMK